MNETSIVPNHVQADAMRSTGLGRPGITDAPAAFPGGTGSGSLPRPVGIIGGPGFWRAPRPFAPLEPSMVPVPDNRST